MRGIKEKSLPNSVGFGRLFFGFFCNLSAARFAA